MSSNEEGKKRDGKKLWKKNLNGFLLWFKEKNGALKLRKL